MLTCSSLQGRPDDVFMTLSPTRPVKFPFKITWSHSNHIKRNVMKIIFSIPLLILLTFSCCEAQMNVQNQQVVEIVNMVADSIERYYVDEKMATLLSKSLRNNISTGKYFN